MELLNDYDKDGDGKNNRGYRDNDDDDDDRNYNDEFDDPPAPLVGGTAAMLGANRLAGNSVPITTISSSGQHQHFIMHTFHKIVYLQREVFVTVIYTFLIAYVYILCSIFIMATNYAQSVASGYRIQQILWLIVTGVNICDTVWHAFVGLLTIADYRERIRMDSMVDPAAAIHYPTEISPKGRVVRAIGLTVMSLINVILASIAGQCFTVPGTDCGAGIIAESVYAVGFIYVAVYGARCLYITYIIYREHTISGATVLKDSEVAELNELRQQRAQVKLTKPPPAVTRKKGRQQTAQYLNERSARA